MLSAFFFKQQFMEVDMTCTRTHGYITAGKKTCRGFLQQLVQFRNRTR